ncbi:MAG: low molecular weight phosphatase family protein [Hyphomicrobiales bacterium]|uniref:arsenate-mycothiol transferase ArsC n=1 Tax=Rhabdaerophilum calidifontis TaxID=2604328 RepID=UPI001FE9ACF9|nr:low molecular weight phosphatase family protein [Rhabdaerophilum calidifontis]MCA1952938.1 low molecular weight phosphatase family protein [Hyphomicrobiales bacterium]MCA1999601.1 low molecular weight phosphatase family protein [Hyphomicrobiales bacterium]
MNAPARPLQAILFVCSMNAVRSPMAEALARLRLGRRVYVDSAGLRKGERDAFALAVLRENGIDFGGDEPRNLDEIDCEGFDLVVALSPEAHRHAAERLRATAAELLFWPIEDATLATGSREQRIEAYRQVRDTIDRRIREEIVPRLRG